MTEGFPTHITRPEVVEQAAEEVPRRVGELADAVGIVEDVLALVVDEREVVVVSVGRHARERLGHERRQQAVLAGHRGADLPVGGDVVRGADRAVVAEVELELAGGVLVVAVAHVEAHPLAVIDDVEQHRTQFLELVDVVAVGLGHTLRVGLGLAAAHPHHLGLDSNHEVEPELGLELAHDPLEVLARIGVEQLAGLGVVAVAVHPGDALVPGQDRERVEVGDRGQLGLLRPKADVVAVAVGEQVRGRAVDELVALLGDLWEERRNHALAHHAPCHRDLLEEDVADVLGLDPLGQGLDLGRATLLVSGLLQGRGRHLHPGVGEDGLDRPSELISGHCRGSFP